MLSSSKETHCDIRQWKLFPLITIGVDVNSCCCTGGLAPCGVESVEVAESSQGEENPYSNDRN